VQSDVDALKTALAGDDEAAVKTAFDALAASQSKIGEALYSQTEGADGAPGADETPEQPTATGTDEDIVDAEVVDDEPETKK
jgi:molecular chaperone DnaK